MYNLLENNPVFDQISTHQVKVIPSLTNDQGSIHFSNILIVCFVFKNGSLIKTQIICDSINKFKNCFQIQKILEFDKI